MNKFVELMKAIHTVEAKHLEKIRMVEMTTNFFKEVTKDEKEYLSYMTEDSCFAFVTIPISINDEQKEDFIINI